MTWTEAEAKFATNFTAYEPRLPQRNLALSIEQALAAGEHLFAQAPCGVGKSYAAAVGAIDYARHTGHPVAMAPGTKALQDQYIRDMEMLRKVYVDFNYVVAKGRSNYLCRAKVKKLDESLHGLRAQELLEAAEVEGVNGDMDRLGMQFTDTQRYALTMSSDECPGRTHCPFGEICFAEQVKKKAAVADVVIVNHALLAIDAVLKSQGIEMLPGFSAIVIDEVQEFEGYATNALSSQVTEGSFTSLISEIATLVDDRSLVGPANGIVSALFGKLSTVLENSRANKAETTAAITPAILLTLESELLGALKLLQSLEAKLAMVRATDEDHSLRLRRIKKRTVGLQDKLKAIILSDFDAMVRWIEQTERRRADGLIDRKIVLAQAPLEVSQFLASAVWPWQPVVFMSATLAIGDDFGFLADKLGVQSYRTFDCESPFDFATQALTYVPSSLPDPSKEPAAFRSAVNLNVTELVRASDGRALLLFTSWAGLNSAYDALAPVIRSMGHRVFKQGEAPTRDLAESFKSDEHSVLFAVKSFFTGVDIQGDSLRLLVIDKLPFPVKDVLFTARCDAHDAKIVSPSDKFRKGSFMAMWVPEMIITLQQGFGRAIRSRSDRALVAILDPRLHSKPSYGRKVLQVLPPARQTTDLQEAVSYLRELDVPVPV
jgi:ATP-dependent DNA helicase DinG